jgi:serine/threonine protein kinase
MLLLKATLLSSCRAIYSIRERVNCSVEVCRWEMQTKYPIYIVTGCDREIGMYKGIMKCVGWGFTDERLNDIVGSAYYVAPEVLHRSYSMEADVWSIGVITYILLCGSRPFWARTESGIFRAVLRADPSFEEVPWPSISPQAKDFVKRLLNKDLRRRMTAAQALGISTTNFN